MWHKLYREEGLRKWLSHHTSHQSPGSPKQHRKVAVITFSYRQPVRAVQTLKLNDPTEIVTFRCAACYKSSEYLIKHRKKKLLGGQTRRTQMPDQSQEGATKFLTHVCVHWLLP